jgi:hypothetical protein
MSGGSLLSRLLVALTLAVAVLALAPSQVQAHAGHSHAVPAAAMKSAVHTVDVQAFQVTRIARDLTGSDGFASLSPEHGAKAPAVCPQGCCHSGGTSCCPFWLAAAPVVRAPAMGRPIFVIAAIGGSGITPGALPEPPNTLV